jgi:hypothetical protein
MAAAKAILRLRDEADVLGVPVIYVNDNYGQWHSERSRIVEYCLRDGSLGAEIVEMIKPREDDYFVIKSQFSGFYASSLQVLLPKLKANRLILTGVAADICRSRCPHARIWAVGAEGCRRRRRPGPARMVAGDHAQQHGRGDPLDRRLAAPGMGGEW